MSQSESHQGEDLRSQHELRASMEHLRPWEEQTGDQQRPMAVPATVNVSGTNNPTFLGPVDRSSLHFHQHVHVPPSVNPEFVRLPIQTDVRRLDSTDAALTRLVWNFLNGLCELFGWAYVRQKVSSWLELQDGELEQVTHGSVTFIVRIMSRKGLNKLWSMYTTGKLAKKLTKTLITDELTTEDKSGLVIQVTILESDYEQACRFFDELQKDQQKDKKDASGMAEVQHTLGELGESSTATTATGSDTAKHSVDRVLQYVAPDDYVAQKEDEFDCTASHHTPPSASGKEIRPVKSRHSMPVTNTACTSHSPESMVSYAEQLALSSRRVSSEVGSPAVCLVPLMEQSVSTTRKFRSYSCCVPSGMPSPNKVIMVVGATGTGKSTLINAMANYVLGVKWEDNFRFKLVDERGEASESQAHSRTQNITSYTIHHNDNINVPYTLTIIDTPGFGDTRGIEHDKAIVEQIREFFSQPESHGVDHIDAVGFVVQSSQARLIPAQRYVFESIRAVFGKDIEPNILLLITFCDGQSPKVLKAVQEAELPFGSTFTFNNSAVFASRENSLSAAFWCMGYKSMNEFFDALDGLQPRSLRLTVEVLKERTCLEIALKGLQPQIQFAREKTEQLTKDKKMLEVYEQKIEAHKYFEYDAKVAKLTTIPNPDKGSTNCPKCLFTCHYPCTSRAKYRCHAMSLGNCTVCPGKCSSGDHVHENFRYKWQMVREKQTYNDIENRYRDAKGRKQTREEVIKKVEVDLAQSETAVSELIDESHRCTQRLQEIALRPNPIGITEYIDTLIESEKATKKPDWVKMVGSLEATKQTEHAKVVVKDADVSGNVLDKLWKTQ